MPVANENCRITFSTSKKMEKWISQCAKKLKCTKSKFLQKIIRIHYWNFKNMSDVLTQEELKEIIRIAKTKWLDEE